MKTLCFSILLALGIDGLAQTIKTIDLTESLIQWTGENLFKLGGHHGTLNFRSGELRFEGDSLVGGQLYADMHSMTNTDGEFIAPLVDHLKSEDFFHVEKFPVSVFSILSVRYLSDSLLSVTGELTIKEVTRPMAFEARLEESAGSTLSFLTDFFIDRSLWNVRFGSKSFFTDLGDDAISDAIRLQVKVVAGR